MKTIYKGDSRYEKVYEQMQLLGIQDVSTKQQVKNGTIVWRLPILSEAKGRYIEYAAFASGYVRNQGVDCRSNWQINKCKMGKREYISPNNLITYEYDTKERILIPHWEERLIYLAKFIIKNYYQKPTYVMSDYVMDCLREAYKRDYNNQPSNRLPFGDEVQVIVNGHRYNLS